MKIKLDEFHIINPNFIFLENQIISCFARIRYRQPLQEVELILKENFIYVLFKELQKGITPGQFAAFYIEEELVYSGVIMS